MWILDWFVLAIIMVVLFFILRWVFTQKGLPSVDPKDPQKQGVLFGLWWLFWICGFFAILWIGRSIIISLMWLALFKDLPKTKLRLTGRIIFLLIGIAIGDALWDRRSWFVEQPIWDWIKSCDFSCGASAAQFLKDLFGF